MENKDYCKRYYDNNKHLKFAYERNRRKTDPVYRKRCHLRRGISLGLEKGRFSNNIQNILGCDYNFYKAYIESKFESWMSWDKKGLYDGTYNYGFDIDHIIPLSTAKSIEELIELLHYSNTQPLCSMVNRYDKRVKEQYG